MVAFKPKNASAIKNIKIKDGKKKRDSERKRKKIVIYLHLILHRIDIAIVAIFSKEVRFTIKTKKFLHIIQAFIYMIKEPNGRKIKHN